MLFPGHRRLRLLLASSLYVVSLTACADAAGRSPNNRNNGNSNTGDGDNAGGEFDDLDGDGDSTGIGDGDGDVIDDGFNDDGSCDGFAIGARCVKKEHIEFIEESPQGTDPGNLVYDFDKRYENLGALKKDKPKIPPNADLGEWYMYNGDYVRIGVAYESYFRTGGKIADKDRIPQREGRNKDLTWNLNAVKAQDGITDLAAPNCMVCHFTYFGDKLIPGLGRNKHFIASDASGFTLDVFGIALNSVFALDSLAQLDQSTSMLARLFPDTMHSHLFDIFAALGMRHDPDTLAWTGELWGDPNSGMKGWIDFPAWWNVKKKNALYSAGAGRGYKSDHLLYMSWFSVEGIPEAEEITNNFVHVQKFLEEKMKAPKFEDFGGKIDQALADKGEVVFNESCATCHGTYSEDESEETYPNALVDLAEIGTDPNLAKNHWIYPVTPWYEASWYGKQGTSSIVKVNGYMAPPLDGVFITAPYFHNGSVPTLEGVLDPEKRPAVWTSNMSADDYDFEKIGWKDKPFDTTFWTLDQRQGAYFTSDPGNSNKGHTYGAALSAEEKKAVLEYLKTL